VDVGHVFFGGQFGVRHINEVFSARKINQVVPLLNISGHIGGIAAIGFLEQGETAA